MDYRIRYLNDTEGEGIAEAWVASTPTLPVRRATCSCVSVQSSADGQNLPLGYLEAAGNLRIRLTSGYELSGLTEISQSWDGEHGVLLHPYVIWEQDAQPTRRVDLAEIATITTTAPRVSERHVLDLLAEALRRSRTSSGQILELTLVTGVHRTVSITVETTDHACLVAGDPWQQ